MKIKVLSAELEEWSGKDDSEGASPEPKGCIFISHLLMSALNLQIYCLIWNIQRCQEISKESWKQEVFKGWKIEFTGLTKTKERVEGEGLNWEARLVYKRNPKKDDTFKEVMAQPTAVESPKIFMGGCC